MSDPLGMQDAIRRTGAEHFYSGATELGFDLLSFWQWSWSDLLSNATRGVIAEFLVANALGVAAGGVRHEWAAYDLETPEGVTVEVKSAAYLQRWHQDQLSSISFVVPKTRAWDPRTNRMSNEVARQAHVASDSAEHQQWTGGPPRSPSGDHAGAHCVGQPYRCSGGASFGERLTVLPDAASAAKAGALSGRPELQRQLPADGSRIAL
jgi:hypothetical protein